MTYNPRGFTNIGSVNMNRPFVNGNREQTNNFTVDGLDVNETIDNRVAYQPSPDALAEISVETNNYAADIGNVGGRRDQQRHQVGQRTQFRGNVFEFYRNSDFDANTWENNRSGAPTPGAQAAHLRRHAGRADRQGQAVLLRRLPGLAAGRPGFGTASVAPEAWRRGDLSSVATVDPRSAHRPALPGQPDPARAGSARPRARS